jgi:hypothetical protein
MRALLDRKLDKSKPFQGAVFDDPNMFLTVREGDPRVIHGALLLPYPPGYMIAIRIFDVFTGVFVVTDDARRYPHPHSDAMIMDVVQPRFTETTVSNLIQGISEFGVATKIR